MAEIITFGSSKDRELSSKRRVNGLRALLEKGKSLDRFTKVQLVSVALFSIATSVIVSQSHIFTPQAATLYAGCTSGKQRYVPGKPTSYAECVSGKWLQYIGSCGGSVCAMISPDKVSCDLPPQSGESCGVSGAEKVSVNSFTQYYKCDSGKWSVQTCEDPLASQSTGKDDVSCSLR